ncbi:MAG: hypothetical protein MUF18_20920 [Fimbriiglobus sp.]|jgi:hypothetical protein|nr:hypothetical protein [Fimbriiglobus sp.]
MTSRFTFAVVAAALTFALVGCGGSEKTVVPTNLSQPTPPKPSGAGGGGGGAGKTEGPKMPQGKAE